MATVLKEPLRKHMLFVLILSKQCNHQVLLCDKQISAYRGGCPQKKFKLNTAFFSVRLSFGWSAHFLVRCNLGIKRPLTGRPRAHFGFRSRLDHTRRPAQLFDCQKRNSFFTDLIANRLALPFVFSIRLCSLSAWYHVSNACKAARHVGGFSVAVSIVLNIWNSPQSTTLAPNRQVRLHRSGACPSDV